MSNGKPLRRRGSALEAALLDATWDELMEVGYDQLTFDGVAKRAGTSKTVLYRRWANRLELVHAALRRRQPLISGYVPDTGLLRSDMQALLEHIAAGLDKSRMAISWSMMADAIGNQKQHEYMRKQIQASNLEVMRAVLQHAAERGEIKFAEIPARILTLPIDLLRHEAIIMRRPVTKETIRQIVDEIFLPLVFKP